MTNKKATTREEWLMCAVKPLTKIIENAGATVPENVRVSCGFPGGGSARKRIGEAWSTSCSADGAHETFISPVLSDVVDVLHVLQHELIHHAVGVDAGHGPAFRKVAVASGLTGKMTATIPHKDHVPVLKEIADKLPPYPHGAISLGNRKKQGTRLLKAVCPCCGYTVRLTAKWADIGLPICPECDESFELA